MHILISNTLDWLPWLLSAESPVIENSFLLVGEGADPSSYCDTVS